MVGSASGPGSTFKAFLGSTRVRVPLSNKIRVRVGSAQHIYGSLRVRIFGPVKTSSSNLDSVTWNSSMSSCFQILLVPLCGPEGELVPGVSFRVRFPFLLLHGSFLSGQRRNGPPIEPGFSQGFFLHSVTDGVLVPCRCRLWLA